MQLQEFQKICKDLLSRVQYPRVGTVIGLQEELGKLSKTIMDIEIYNKPIDQKVLGRKCVEVFFSFVDLCNSYDINLHDISIDRIQEVKGKIEKWEKEHGQTLRDKREKLD
ncbi:MAG: hypothetical protein HYZ08_00895 [Candidatus Kerfeldbacteria bacterium]|nr:hypothetical protein [Candidatus Kerfeldbacteria bacterium]